MQRCIALAKNGLGTTYPNPLVGCVIVHNHQIIGEGWHYKSGEPHAEIMAINAVKDKDLLRESTLYVNLEPCSHHGKTPPCSQKIVEQKIPNVVIGCRDLAAHVNGKGIEHLQKNGITVLEGILEEECNWLNRRFFTFHSKKRPFIILKYAQTHNHFFAPTDGSQKWITQNLSKQLVHKWRTEEAAILIGKNTALSDKPQLTARLWKGNQPIRVLIAKNLNFDYLSFVDGKNSIIFNGEKSEHHENFELIQIDFEQNVLNQILFQLHQLDICSIIIEGGKITLDKFIEQNLWDEARVITGKTEWQNGIESPQFSNAKSISQTMVGEDHIEIFVNSKPYV